MYTFLELNRFEIDKNWLKGIYILEDIISHLGFEQETAIYLIWVDLELKKVDFKENIFLKIQSVI